MKFSKFFMIWTCFERVWYWFKIAFCSNFDFSLKLIGVTFKSIIFLPLFSKILPFFILLIPEPFLKTLRLLLLLFAKKSWNKYHLLLLFQTSKLKLFTAKKERNIPFLYIAPLNPIYEKIISSQGHKVNIFLKISTELT